MRLFYYMVLRPALFGCVGAIVGVGTAFLLNDSLTAMGGLGIVLAFLLGLVPTTVGWLYGTATIPVDV